MTSEHQLALDLPILAMSYHQAELKEKWKHALKTYLYLNAPGLMRKKLDHAYVDDLNSRVQAQQECIQAWLFAGNIKDFRRSWLRAYIS